MPSPKQYENIDRFPVALDTIIFGFDRQNLKLLLIKRDFEPEKGNWSLMGGFLEANESLDDAASRILTKLTGLKNIYLEQLYGFGEIDRDPVERTISIAYYSLIDIHDQNKDFVKKYSARWFPIDGLPELIFDHKKMVEAAKARLRYKAARQPVGFELLPEKFTLPELQHLYESIYETELDKRNFRRRILSMGVLIKTKEKQRGFSKKGAYLYKFDNEKFKELNATPNDANIVFKPPKI
ncbi:NUDIX hydrolase [Rhodohalobacter sp. 614A]|uniref:NUDIX hydrolase n=1 Tax=Rhodohalobacter sp. 614A TaxID=2908649 RepID=UPI001F25603C|nr:NUDIX domain-containing protein [Rhodohalobacter sp. 614A]